MKIKFRIIATFLFLGIFSVLLESCCTDTFTILSVGEMEARSFDDFEVITTVQGPFQLMNNFEVEKVAQVQQLSLINRAHATTCEHEVTNPLDASTFKITTDRDFLFDGNTIEANTDFTELLGQNLFISDTYFSDDLIRIEFFDFVLEQFEFEKADYTFKFEIETADGTEMENELTLTMDL